MKYTKSSHLHVGYYERGHDLEAVALKVVGRQLWHVFFPFDEYALGIPKGLEDSPRDPLFGTLILTCADEADVQREYVEWVETKLLSQLRREESRRNHE